MSAADEASPAGGPEGAPVAAEAGGSGVVPAPEGETTTVLWLELFFDLVAVAAMVVLATAFEDHATWVGVAMFSLTFTAIWMCWSSLALYVNLADQKVERRTIVAGMAAIAVMATALLHIDVHANAFALAFLACRVLTIRGARRTGRILAAWPVLLGGASLPWVVSLWVPEPWKFWLWALGLVIDLVTLGRRHDTGEAVAQMNERAARARARGEATPSFVVASIREHHLTERLGTFVIIVLGESVLQLVRAASETAWSGPMWVATAASFLVIVGIWRQTFAYGFTAAPGAVHAEDRLASAMVLHLISTGSLVILAAALGEVVRHADEHVHEPWGWVAGGALAVYFATSVASATASGAGRRWLLGWGLPATSAGLVLGAVSHQLRGSVFALLLVVPVLWELSYGRRATLRAARRVSHAEAPPGP